MCTPSAIRRFGMAISTIFFITSITLTIMALASEHWVNAQVLRQSGDNYTIAGHVHTGVFYGQRAIDYGLGERTVKFGIYQELTNGTSFFTMGVWLGVIVCALLSIVLAIVGTLFGIVNTILKPVNTLAGTQGMYIWSSTALCSSLISAMFFGLQYATVLQYSLLHEQHVHDIFSTNNLGTGYYLFMTGIMCHVLTMCTLIVTQSNTVQSCTTEENKQELYIVHDARVMMY